MPSFTMLSPIGPLTVTEEDGALRTLVFGAFAPSLPSTPLLCRTQTQLQEYFSGRRRNFTLPLAPKGTAFQCAVWRALQEIPYGQRRTYGQLAAQIGRPRACRAVGMANHCNPLPVIIPCHRVIGADGSLTGYAGGLERKAFLLALEQSAAP